MTKLLLVTGKWIGKSTTLHALLCRARMKTILISSVHIALMTQFFLLLCYEYNASKAISGRVNKVKEAFAGMFSNLFPNMDTDMVSLSI